MLIAEHRLKQHYSRAFELLEETEGTAVFPVQHYDWHSARALLLFEIDSHSEARAEAKIALEFARIDDSGISRHKDVGLVSTTEDDLGLRLMRIAGEAHATPQLVSRRLNADLGRGDRTSWAERVRC